MIVADYIANFLAKKGISQVFSVVGGGAMYLNDSLGHHPGLNVLYNHHEQASSIAAESFARLTNKLAVVCVTSGPGGTNAMTGCLCAYMGSIPMLILSGQVRYPFTVRGSGLPLRTLGEQEFDICESARAMTKHAELIVDPKTIREHLERAIFLATSGRPGPVWLDIPLDVQSAEIDPERLPGFDPKSLVGEIPPPVSEDIVADILSRVGRAERPILYVGMGVRLAGAFEELQFLIDRLGIPVVTGMSSIDCIHDDHPLYAGRAGVTGNRAGNFAVQNSDLLLAIGSRLSLKQTGYNFDTWARDAYKIVCDIDFHELQREGLGIHQPVWADAGDLIARLNEALDRSEMQPVQETRVAWITQCRTWLKRFPVITEAHHRTPDGKASLYVLYGELSKRLQEEDILVSTSGMSRVVGRQALEIKEGQRFIVNHTASPMGYCVPASIGACLGNERRPVTLVTGEGGFQMNIQELQTIKHHQLPIRIIVVNNDGYHSIRQTQSSYFGHRSKVGIGEESGDLSFPELSKIAKAYRIPYLSCGSNDELPSVLANLFSHDGPVICEVFVTTAQATEPKAATKRLDDGRMVSAPLEDMAPFLSRQELEENMFIPLVD